MQAGNAFYRTKQDLPHQVPILTLPTVVLLPGGFVSITIETKYQLQLIDDVMQSDRLLGLIQPCQYGDECRQDPKLYDIGCLGRITSYSEIGNGHVLISLHGVCRFQLLHETASAPYRIFSILPFDEDLNQESCNDAINRESFLSILQDYLAINDMQADWKTIMEASDDVLVNAFAAIAPFGVVEKQALLEAPDLKTRSETLIAIAERALLRQNEEKDHFLH